MVPPAAGRPPSCTGFWPPATAAPSGCSSRRPRGGEGGPGEGGGQVLGTITEFRLGSTDPGAFAYDASAQVAAYAALVHDAYVAAHAGAVALQAAIGALLADPSPERLDAARQAWVDARPAYMRTEAFQFYAGPIDGPGGPLPRLNAWPVDPAFIDGIVDDPSVPLDFRSLARLNQADAPEQVTTGWHAIELLLWGEYGRPAARRRSSPARARTTGGATISPRAAQLLVNDLGLAGRGLGAGRQQLPRLRRGDGPAQRARPRLQRHDRARRLRDPAAPDRRRALPRQRELPAVAVQRHLRRRQPRRLRGRARRSTSARASTRSSPASTRRSPPRSHAAFDRADTALAAARRAPMPASSPRPPAAPSAPRPRRRCAPSPISAASSAGPATGSACSSSSPGSSPALPATTASQAQAKASIPAVADAKRRESHTTRTQRGSPC